MVKLLLVLHSDCASKCANSSPQALLTLSAMLPGACVALVRTAVWRTLGGDGGQRQRTADDAGVPQPLEREEESAKEERE